MSKIKRKIIKIDEEKCNGCEQCIPSCPEGALKIVQTPKGPKARLVKENFCDGLGACLGTCPMDAITEGDDAYEVNTDRCLGCGVCVPTCPSEAIKLNRKPEEEHTKPADNMVAWMMERSASTGKSLESFM